MTDSGPLTLAIYQRVLMHYRVPLFNGISRRFGGQLRLIVGGIGDGVDCSALECEVHEHPAIRFGPFVQSRRLGQALHGVDTLVMPFDLQEVQSVWRTMRCRPPVILWGHSHGSHDYLTPPRRWLGRRSSAIIVYTEAGRKRLIDEGAGEDRVFVANNTVDVPEPGFDSTTERSSFLFSGRLTERKKIDEALSAFSQLDDASGIRFEIVGDGPDLYRLQHLAKELGIASRVTFHGAIYDQFALRDIFKRSLAMVSPGHVGLSVLHSFAYGIPLVTRRIAAHAPEFTHLKDEENSLLFDGSPADLTAIMGRLADPGFSRQLGRRSYEHYEASCTLDRAIDGFERAIQFARRQSVSP